jgi:hypothetical protein
VRELQEVSKIDRQASKFELKSLIPAMQTLSVKDSSYRVSFVTFLSKRDPMDVFNEWSPTGFSHKGQAHVDFSLVSLRRIIKRTDIEGGRREINGRFIVFGNKKSGVWTALTSDGADFFNTGLVRFLELHRPEISRVYASTDEMRRIFETLSDDLRAEVFVQKAVLYSHLEEGEVTFKKEPYRRLFAFAEAEDDYVDKVEFKLVTGRTTALHAFLSRDATLYYYAGRAGLVFSKIIPLLVEVATRKGRLFSNKARPLGEAVLNPIEIDYERDVLTSPQDNVRFVQALTKLDRGAVTVYHLNPYLHISFVDFVDGSSFSIYSGESDKVFIVPNFNCTVHSLMRIHEQINRDFQEGVLKEPILPSPTLEDFVGA